MRSSGQILSLLGLLLWLGAVASAAQSVRVATYNLDNYLVMDRHVGGAWRPSYPKPEGEKAIIRNTILSLKPDILALQEIGGTPFLEELRADLAQLGLQYDCAILMQGEDQERHTAVLSRIAPQAVFRHDDLDLSILRGARR